MTSKDDPTVSALASRGYDHHLEDYIRNLPKVELHVHLDGSFDPNILYHHLVSVGLSCLPDQTILPWDQSAWPVRKLVDECKSEQEFHSLCTCRGKRSLYEMIKCFEIFLPVVRGNLNLIEELSYDFCRRQSQQRVMYTEVRYSPHLLATGGSLNASENCVDPSPVLDAVTRGLRRGEQDFKIVVNQILCCICWRPDWADDVIRLAHERRDAVPCSVVGVDIAAGEEHFDGARFPHIHSSHVRALQRAQELGLNITIHAGEVGPSENVRAAVKRYGASRIGHGYNVVGSHELMDFLRENGIHMEVCPTSSKETGGWDYEGTGDWEHHPANAMLNHGLSLGLNSDDPAVFDTSIAWQFRIGVAKMKLPQEALLNMTKCSIEAAFCSEETKHTLHEKLFRFEIGNKDPLSFPFDDRVLLSSDQLKE